MPIPFIIGGLAALAGATGIGAGIYGASKAKEAKETLEIAQRRHKRNISRYEEAQKTCTAEMDELGTLEMEVLSSFEHFSDLFAKIQNRPKFEEIEFGDRGLPDFNPEHLREVSVGAGVLLGSLKGAVAGTAGGIAAAGGVTAAAMSFGTAGTGTAIAGLSGAAATNATLAMLGGGTLAAGGGGVALGATLLSAATLGVGLMIGGAIVAFTGSKLSDKADEAWYQMKRAEEKIDTICSFLDELKEASSAYKGAMEQVRHLYDTHIAFLENLLGRSTDWNRFDDSDKLNIMNLVHLVSILYAMCKEKLVLKNEDEEEVNTLNKEGISAQMTRAEEMLGQVAPL